jgi:HlyD family secretion protein
MKKLLVILVLLLLAGGVGYEWYNAGSDRPQFRTLPVTRGDLFIGVTATGRLKPEIIDVGAQIVGMIKSFGPDRDKPDKPIDYNSRVRQGDVLAQLDDRPHRVALEKAVAGLKMAEAEVKQSRAHRDQAERNFHRAERLRSTNSVADFEAAQSQYEIAQAELAVAEAKVQQAAAAKKEAEINLDYTTIRATADGTIIARRVNVGQTVVAGMNAPSLFLLARDLGRTQVWAEVNEADIGDVHIGQKVLFQVDDVSCRERTFTGKVAQIRMDASMESSVVSYAVIVDVDNTDGKLKPYMTAKLKFEVQQRVNVPRVPDQALRWRPIWDEITPSARGGFTRPTAGKAKRADNNDPPGEVDEATIETSGPTVWLRADDGLVRPVSVKLGISDGINTEITGGDLHVDDEVVIHDVRAAKPDFVSSFVNRVIKK